MDGSRENRRRKRRQRAQKRLTEFCFKEKLRNRTVSGWDTQPGQEFFVSK